MVDSGVACKRNFEDTGEVDAASANKMDDISYIYSADQNAAL